MEGLCELHCGGVKMIQIEFYTQRKDGVKLYRTYSDAGMMIRQNETGAEYAEAIDVENAAYTYEETDMSIDTDELTDMRLSALERSINIITGQE